MERPNSLTEYYERRAGEYEDMYARPHIQADLGELKGWLAEQVRHRRLLEVACGTGYWTAVAASTAQTIQATDINPGPLAIARSKGLGSHVTFTQADAYALPQYNADFDCGMANLWWSHIPKVRQHAFLTHFLSRLGKGANLVMIDNNFVPGTTQISYRDEYGNTYQTRTLRSGEQYEVLKNFPTRSDLRAALSTFWRHVCVLELRHFWAVSGQDA
jgi:demethylmenaquinone methyltransferase/2-methoxy-6-polyprenyl-1,4-benzoquinol methylase